MGELEASLELPCGARLAKQIARAAMSEQLAAPGHLPDEQLVRLCQRWVAGGAGLRLTGNVMLDPQSLGEAGNVVLAEGMPPRALHGLGQRRETSRHARARYGLRNALRKPKASAG